MSRWPGDIHRVGVFGLFGGGNSGNEASLEAMLSYLRDRHPEAVIDAMSGGFQQVPGKFGIPATPLMWLEYHDQVRGPARAVAKVVGKAIDPLRLFRWVRQHDAVIVPGMGVLEDSTPVRAYAFPLSMFLLAAAGRACRVKVALVSVGASVVRSRATRLLFAGCARMAAYRSYRDAYSREAIRQAGVDTSRDEVFPDLAFALPVPPHDPGDPFLVAVGVMDYNGGNDDRARAAELHAAYVEKMSVFVCWLLDSGYRVRFFGGDDLWDYDIAAEITSRARERRPEADVADRVMAEPFASYADLLAELNHVGTVVATRYHNVLGALKLGKPTIAIGYSHKFVALMDSVGLAEYTQPASAFDIDLLIKQFEDLQGRREAIAAGLVRHNATCAEDLARQFATLSRLLFDDPAG